MTARHSQNRRRAGFALLGGVVLVSVIVVLARGGITGLDPDKGSAGKPTAGAGSSGGQSASPGPTGATPTPAGNSDPGPPNLLPGFLLIADRGNDRMLLVDVRRRILWRYPRSGVQPSMPFNYDDDTFFSPDRRSIISNQEEQHTVEQISFPAGKVLWSYGHVNVSGSSPGYLHTPDDAYLLPNGQRMVADVHNCRVLFIDGGGHIVKQYGTTGVCRHGPPRFLDQPNGDTPIPGGGVLITEINGSWIDAIGPDGKLMWAFQTPVAYPSDAQWLGHGRILLADYSKPGHVLIMGTDGTVLWRYGPPTGPRALDHPSLAMMLPNGLIAVNDDYHHRVVLIDPKTKRIVWHYGHLDQSSRLHGYLNTPDGMDFLPWKVGLKIPVVRRAELGSGH